MSNDIHKKFSANHTNEPFTRQADASSDLARRREEREKAEKAAIESRFERIEKRLEQLESLEK